MPGLLFDIVILYLRIKNLFVIRPNNFLRAKNMTVIQAFLIAPIKHQSDRIIVADTLGASPHPTE